MANQSTFANTCIDTTMKCSALLLFLAASAAAGHSTVRFQSKVGPDVLIQYDGATLTVPQHCRS